uniref:hypothetical protein n=1 Tax=uncultured Acidovorax sp. TaxID=158751 RepID=UPI0025E31F9E|nr:hypothetical protein [uncultured Acidovorax sp.]
MATDDTGAFFDVSARESMLAHDLYRFSRLLPAQALGSVVREIFMGMSARYADRLGVSADRIEQEHQALAATAHVLSS